VHPLPHWQMAPQRQPGRRFSVVVVLVI